MTITRNPNRRRLSRYKDLRYVGPKFSLHGCRARVQIDPACDTVLVQFDFIQVGGRTLAPEHAFGWYEYPRKHFVAIDRRIKG